MPEIIVPEIVVLRDGDTADPATQVVRLFDEFRESLFRYLRWLGCLPEEADDAIQETFLRLYAHLAARGSQENLRAWLFRVAGNVVRDGMGDRHDDGRAREDNGDTGADHRPLHDAGSSRPQQRARSQELGDVMQDEVRP